MASKSNRKHADSQSNAQPELIPIKGIGKIPPQAIQLEEAILGGLMTDHKAMSKIKTFISPEVFYKEEHQNIYKAITDLDKGNQPIDVLTVTEGLKANGTLESLGGPYYLVELSNKVASGANLEYHSKILYQKYMRRQVIKHAYKAVEGAFDDTKDVFEVVEELIKKSRFVNPRSMIKYETMNDTMELGSQEKPRLKMFGNLIKEGETVIVFGDEGCGKSVLCMQTAAALAAGTNVFQVDNDDLENSTKKKKVVFYDFELERAELFSRYSDEEAIRKFQNKKDKDKFWKDFDPNFIRAYIDPEFLDFEDSDKHILAEVEQGILEHKPDVVFIDNITFITTEATDPKIATKLMKKLAAIQQQNQGLTIVVIAHTPKRDSSMPFESKHIAGAKNIANFAKSIVAVGKSQLDPSRRYLKHTKCRNGKLIHGFDNVVECRIDKEYDNLAFEFVGYGEEKTHLHLQSIGDRKEQMDNFIWEMKTQLNPMSYNQISKAIFEKFEGFTMDKTTVMRRFKTMEKAKLENEQFDKEADNNSIDKAS